MFKTGSQIQHRNWSYRQTLNYIVVGRLKRASRLIEASMDWSVPFTMHQMVALQRQRDKWLDRKRFWPVQKAAQFWAWKWGW